MSTDRDTPPGPDRDLASVLRREAQEHEPDVEQMLRRVRAAAERSPAPARPWLPAPAWVSSWGGAAAAAAVVAILMVGANLLMPSDPPPAPAGPLPSASVTSGPPMVTARAAHADGDRAVALTAAQTQDFVVAGVGDDATRLARRGSGPGLLSVATEPDTISALGAVPFVVDFGGGTEPFGNGRTKNRGWVSTSSVEGRRSGLSVEVAPAQGRQDLTVWASLGEGDGQVALAVDDLVVYTLTLPGQTGEPIGYVLTVPLDDVDAAAVVELRITAPTGVPVGLAAAAVQ